MKIFIADDHQLFLEGMRSMLLANQPDFDIQFAHNGQDALDTLSGGEDFDVALIDLRLPCIDGFGLLEKLADANCFVPVIIVTASEDPTDIQQCIDLGAMGFLSKSASGEQIIDAINRVVAGEIVTPLDDDGEHADSEQNWASQHNITPRQLQILRSLRQGKSNQQIADQLFISMATVKTHIAAIFNALKVKSRTEAIQKASQLGLD